MSASPGWPFGAARGVEPEKVAIEFHAPVQLGRRKVGAFFQVEWAGVDCGHRHKARSLAAACRDHLLGIKEA